MSSEALDKTVTTGNWQIFSKKLFQHFIHHKEILKVTKFQFKIICRSRVLDKNIPLWYHSSPSPPPGANRVNDFFSKYDQIVGKLRIWSHLLKKSLMKKVIFV